MLISDVDDGDRAEVRDRVKALLERSISRSMDREFK